MFSFKIFIVSGLTFRTLIHFEFIQMVEWHHWLNAHEFEQAPGVGERQGSWHATVHGVTKSDPMVTGLLTWLSDWTELSLFLRMVLGSVLIHLFPRSCPVFPALLIDETVFSPLYILAEAVLNTASLLPASQHSQAPLHLASALLLDSRYSQGRWSRK